MSKKKLKLHFGYILFIGMEVKSKFSLPFLHSLKLERRRNLSILEVRRVRYYVDIFGKATD